MLKQRGQPLTVNRGADKRGQWLFSGTFRERGIVPCERGGRNIFSKLFQNRNYLHLSAPRYLKRQFGIGLITSRNILFINIFIRIIRFIGFIFQPFLTGVYLVEV